MNNLVNLTGSIGPHDDDDNDFDDIQTLQRGLSEVGRTPFYRGFQPGERPDQEITRLQIDNGLQMDSRAFPGGETERALNREILKRRDEDARTEGGRLADPRVEKPVGLTEIGASNTVPDLARTEKTLTRLGFPPVNEHRPTDLMRASALGTAMKGYQMSKGLDPDGVMNPGGPTEQAMVRDHARMGDLAPAASRTTGAGPGPQTGTRGTPPTASGFTPASRQFAAPVGAAGVGTGAGEGVGNKTGAAAGGAAQTSQDAGPLFAGMGIGGGFEGAKKNTDEDIDRNAAAHFHRETAFRVTPGADKTFAFSDLRTGDVFLTVSRGIGRKIANAPGTANGHDVAAKLGLIRDAIESEGIKDELRDHAAAILLGDSGTGAGTAFGGLDGVIRAEHERVQAFLDQAAKLREGKLTEDQRRQVTAALVATVFPKVIDDGESFTRLLMELMPGTGNVLAGIEAKKSFEAARAALKAGDIEGFLTAGGLTVLNGIGTLPGVGNVLKPAIKGAKVGLYRLAGRKGETFEEFIERGQRQSRKPDRRSLTTELRDLLGKENFDALTKMQQRSLVGSFSNVVGRAAESYVAKRIRTYAKDEGKRVIEQVNFQVPGTGRNRKTVVDIAAARGENWRRVSMMRSLNGILDSRWFKGLLVEVKTGRGRPNPRQQAFIDSLKTEGHEVSHVVMSVPFNKIPVEELLRSTKMGNALGAFPERARRELLEVLHSSLPSDVPVWLGYDLTARMLAAMPREFMDDTVGATP